MSDDPENITVTFSNWRNSNAGAAYKNGAGRTRYTRADICDPLLDERVRALVEAVTNLRERANIYARAVDIQAVDAALRAINEPPTDHDRREEK